MSAIVAFPSTGRRPEVCPGDRRRGVSDAGTMNSFPALRQTPLRDFASPHETGTRRSQARGCRRGVKRAPVRRLGMGAEAEMVSRRRWMGSGIVIAAAAAVFLASGGVDGRRGGQSPAAPGATVALRETPREIDPGRVTRHLPPAHGTEPGAPTGSATEDGESSADGARTGDAEVEGSARALMTRMRKLAGDLEFSPGLPEPPAAGSGPATGALEAGPSPGRASTGHRRRRTSPRQDCGWRPGRIRGRNLRVVQVMFGTAPARMLGASGTLVAVEAPPSGPGPVTIAVTNDDGTWAVAGTPITYAE